jgi:hypothetical protein
MMLYKICHCGKHKIWFWSRVPWPKFIQRWINQYKVWKLETDLANQFAEEIRKEIDAEIIEKIRKEFRG